jgi:hypothetical protein
MGTEAEARTACWRANLEDPAYVIALFESAFKEQYVADSGYPGARDEEVRAAFVRALRKAQRFATRTARLPLPLDYQAPE